MEIKNRKWWKAIYVVTAILGVVVAFRNTLGQGQDFEVFWKASRYIIGADGPIYHHGRDGASSFKYPPWIVPAFLPLGLISLFWAKAAWAVVQSLSFSYVIFFLFKRGYTPRILWASSLAFAGIWIVHTLDGQVALPMLALSMLVFDRKGFWGQATLVWALSTKGASLYAAAPRVGVWIKKPHWWIAMAGVLLVLSIPAMRAHEWIGPVPILQKWLKTAASGEQYLGAGVVAGRSNQGFPMMLRRWIPGSSEWMWSLVLFGMFAAIWSRLTERLNEYEEWFGWLAISVICHPLAWFHSFVLVFPLSVAAVQRAIAAKNNRLLLVSGLGVVMVAMVTEKTCGQWGNQLEMLSIKSWGALLSLGVIFFAQKSKTSRKRRRA